MYRGLYKFFKKKKRAYTTTIPAPGKPSQQVIDHGRRGTTKVTELKQFLTNEKFSVRPVPFVSYIECWYKGTTEIHIRDASAHFPTSVPYAWLEKE